MARNTLRGSYSHIRGARNELIAADFFMSHGWDVYFPLMAQSRADLVVTKGSRVKKIQVKTITYCRTGKYLYKQCRLCTNNERQDKFYKIGDFDYLLFVDNVDGSLYLAPISEVQGLTSVCFGSDNKVPRNGKKKTYDYESWKVR